MAAFHCDVSKFRKLPIQFGAIFHLDFFDLELLSLNMCIAYVLVFLASGLPMLWDGKFLRYESNVDDNKKNEIEKVCFFFMLGVCSQCQRIRQP